MAAWMVREQGQGFGHIRFGRGQCRHGIGHTPLSDGCRARPFRPIPGYNPISCRPGGARGAEDHPDLFWSRNGNRKTGHVHNVALTGIKIAKWWVKAPPEQIEALRNLRRQVDPKSSGMTERNRARLRQFDDPENVRRLLRLPHQILRALPRSRPPTYTEAARVQSALAIGILLVAPMRMKNLSALHARHFVRTRIGGPRHIVEKHYNHARSLEASARHTEVLARLRMTLNASQNR
jgi:hypothetical protein